MRKKSKLINGSVFLVPLAASPDFGIGVLMRSDGKGRAYGAFFGPRVESALAVDIARLRLEDAVLCCRFGDYGLHTRRWIIIGSVPNWDERQWPMQPFVRRHDNPTLRYVTEYDDSLNVVLEVVQPASETTTFLEDAQLGAQVVETRLAKLLG